ncbi:MAG TPA: hypothetical protein VER04_24265 [Polyangiaceae bacterium]|nr:hypothetical protein [Polyangiaceae bacterium]
MLFVVCRERVPRAYIRLGVLCVTGAVALCGPVSDAAAQDSPHEVATPPHDVGAARGEFGAEAHALLDFGQELWFGGSVWYRLRPAIALGATVESNMVSSGGEGIGLGKPGVDRGALILKGFVDYRVVPRSFVGLFGRISLGIAHVRPFYPRRAGGPEGGFGTPGIEPTAELGLGPELRIFLSKRAAPRPALFLRFGGSFTFMAPRSFPGFGITLGGEG